MTAEVAIMNKTAVALAADSAVTISAGLKEQKIFDSADKLFELSHHNPIGVMIFNGMSFTQVPLASLIKNFRSECVEYGKIRDAAIEFLQYLNDFGRSAPQLVSEASLRSMVRPIIERINERSTEKFQEWIIKTDLTGVDFNKIRSDIFSEQIAIFERIFGKRDRAVFVGGGDFEFDDFTIKFLRDLIDETLISDDADQRVRTFEVLKLLLKSDYMSDSFTGIVIAGFGSKELFPTLVSFALDGMICGRLKYIETNYVDIDRSGPRASVLPFAQKEMVERFLYGLDGGIENEISAFCERTIKSIRDNALSTLTFEAESDKDAFAAEMAKAEQAFIDGLREKAFASLRSQSKDQIEDMVEFMPKPELAKMAEALVNLTSIKRRVSRGMETVGGPIDVAVISQAEGFVWVKRKHYFPAELNQRYLERIQFQAAKLREVRDATKPKPRSARAARGRVASIKE